MSRQPESPYPPIGDYALIGDCHGAALVSKDGSVDWCCFHRFDSRPVFSRILDWKRGGHFRIAPADEYTSTRRYREGTNVLETTFRTEGGTLEVTDCFPVRESLVGEDGHPVHPYHQLVREVRCTAGEVDVALEFRPRFDYGTTVPRVEVLDDGLVRAYGGADALLLQSPWPSRRTDIGDCGARDTMRAGDREVVSLVHSPPHVLRPQRVDPEVFDERLRTTERYWTDWSSRCTYEGPYRDEVVRSALVLKALTNAPTGAIVAAPTTSLPERIGGVRNWDYRYTWLRDAAFTLDAFFALGYTSEAHSFMDWLKRTTAGRAEELQVLHGVGGEHVLPEFEVDGIDGYRGSRPVRVGNAAVNQFQLDTYGELFDAAWLYHSHGGAIDEGFWELLQGTADLICERWEEPDEGIWEVRGAPRHFVHSKVMCAVGLDRAEGLARELDLPGDVDRWRATRAAVRARVLSEGVDGETQSFKQEFGSDLLDAANLLIPVVGFLPPDDPRVGATLERTAKELSIDGLVHRYLGAEDGLPQGEGAFLLCSFWLVDNLALTGELDQARELFERLRGYANDVGLLSEEVDPSTSDLLGNFPQAFSHLGLINSAVTLSTARGRPGRPSPQRAP